MQYNYMLGMVRIPVLRDFVAVGMEGGPAPANSLLNGGWALIFVRSCTLVGCFNLFLMVFSKHAFFGLLLVLVLAPFVIYKLWWIAGSERTMGTMGFRSKDYAGAYVHEYAVISFKVGNDTVWFNGNDNIFFAEGAPVPVRYPRHRPAEARIDIFTTVWGDTLVYSCGPVAILLLLYLHPHIFPWGCRFRLSRRRPLVSVV